jgi:hypothetical protein
MFKLRIPNLLFTLAAGISSHTMPMPGESGPRQRGKSMPGRNGVFVDTYGTEYRAGKSGGLERTSKRISKLPRKARKAIWSGN